MPLTDLIRYFNAADSAGESTLYPEGERAAAWHRGLRLNSLFQPIVDLRTQRIVGHHATLNARQEDGTPVSAESAYALCTSPEAIIHFDRLCRTLHALNFLAQHDYAGGYLQLAIHPRHLLAVQSQHGMVYEAILKRCGLAPEDIVLAIDAGQFGDDPRLIAALHNYRRRGYRLALHAPAAPDGGSAWLDLQPDILRLELAQLHRLFPSGIPDGVVIELSGIDGDAELALARGAGAQLGHGRLFGPPASDCLPTHSKQRVAYNRGSPSGAPT